MPAATNTSNTMNAIAERVGVSRSTVSRVLSGEIKGSWARSKRQADEIRQVAKQLGYRPNASAKATRLGRFDCVALLQSCEAWHSNLPSELWEGIDSQLLRSGKGLTIARLPDTTIADERFVPKVLREWSADGLVINYNTAIPPRFLKLIRKHNVPSIWLNCKLETDCVRPDDFAAGQMITEYLLAEGHTRIAYCDFAYEISGRAGTLHYSKPDRMAGYRAAMADAGLAPRVVTDERGNERGHGPAYERQAAAAMLTGNDRPTAIISYGGEHHCVRQVAWESGLRPGENLMFGAFSERSRIDPYPGTATAIIPNRKVGERAIELLEVKIADPSQNLPCEKIPYELNVGGRE